MSVWPVGARPPFFNVTLFKTATKRPSHRLAPVCRLSRSESAMSLYSRGVACSGSAACARTPTGSRDWAERRREDWRRCCRSRATWSPTSTCWNTHRVAAVWSILTRLFGCTAHSRFVHDRSHYVCCQLWRRYVIADTTGPGKTHDRQNGRTYAMVIYILSKGIPYEDQIEELFIVMVYCMCSQHVGLTLSTFSLISPF